MSSPLSRFVRMLMLALVLGLASARPAVAADEGPSILRDTETEALFADIAKPLVEAANLDNKSVKVVLLNYERWGSLARLSKLDLLNAVSL